MNLQKRTLVVSDEQAHEYYSLLICSDPYPSDNHELAISLANTIAEAFSFSDWVSHYHSFSEQESLPKLGEIDAL